MSELDLQTLRTSQARREHFSRLLKVGIAHVRPGQLMVSLKWRELGPVTREWTSPSYALVQSPMGGTVI